MPAVQRNWNYYTYESMDGTTYNIRADVEWAAIAAHGLAVRTVGAPRFIGSKSQRPRGLIYRDATTGRTRTGPVGTSAALAATNLGDSQNFSVTGLAAPVAYVIVKQLSEKVPTSIVGPQLADHA